MTRHEKRPPGAARAAGIGRTSLLFGLVVALATGGVVAAGGSLPDLRPVDRQVAADLARAVTDEAFHTWGYQPQPVDEQHLPYGSTVSLPDTSPHDATGVRMYITAGRMYDHPVAQARSTGCHDTRSRCCGRRGTAAWRRAWPSACSPGCRW